LKESGIYHALDRDGSAYVLTGEGAGPWWDPRPDRVHLLPGEPLYAFSAVFAPTRFGTTIVHRWQRYDPDARAWVTQSRIEFPMTGGRTQGFRGYSMITPALPGAFRVRVETENG